jgi:cyclophilin family peptidyl-prolyl cis-trans isomerase
MGNDCSYLGVILAFVGTDPHRSEDEFHPELRFTGAGILAMANSGPNTNGTRFSVVWARPV